MKIPTANIIVGFDRKVMERLFVEGATYTSLIKELTKGEEEDVLLFDNESNPNFISFEHSFNFGQSTIMKLEIIDPKGEFESRFLKDDMIPLVAGSAYIDKDKKGTTFYTASVNREMADSMAEYEDKYFADLKTQFNKHLGDRELYVAYGTGDNLKAWAGPHRMVLIAADLKVKGARKIILTLVPSDLDLGLGNRRGAYNEIVNLNLAGVRNRYAGETRQLDFNAVHNNTGPGYNPLDHLEIGDAASEDITKQNTDIKNALGGIGLNHLSLALGTFDFHSMIVDAIRSYVQKATNNPNVIVLIPNINVICKKHIDSIVNTSRGHIELYIRQFLESFGLNLHHVKKDNIKSTNDRRAIAHPKIKQYNSVEIDTGDDYIDIKRLPGLYKYHSLYYQKYYEEQLFWGILQEADQTSTPDHERVIREVFDKIREFSGEEYPLNPSYFTETDIKLLSFWSTGTPKINPSKFPTFGGYHTFDETREAIIVGDRAFISKYLYGEQSIQQIEDTVEDLRAQTSTKKEYLVNKFHSYEKEFIFDDQLTLAIEKETPLHPLDRVILGNGVYNDLVREITFPDKGSVDGAFGNISFLPDEFAYSDNKLFDDKAKKHIKEKGISIFRYNTQNPNVLDINFKFGAVYFSALKEGVVKQVSRKASLVTEGILPGGIGTLPVRSRGAAIGYMINHALSKGLGDVENQKVLSDLANRLSPELAGELNLNDPEAAADFIAEDVKNAKSDLRGYYEVDQLAAGNPNSILADVMEEAYKLAMRLDIKTLPTFHLSTMSIMDRKCLLLAQDAPITQSKNEERTLTNFFFSGLYQIIGFKHMIDSGSARSEFKLQKIAPNFKRETDEE